MPTSRDVTERFFAAWADRRVEGFDEVVAEDAVIHYGDTPIEGREGIKQLAASFFAAFPDGELTLNEWAEDGDRCAVVWTYSGTHEGELFGIPPTGKRFSASGMNLERVNEGKIVEHWSVFDQMSAFRQLGLA